MTWRPWLFAACCLAATFAAHGEERVRVFAAASLTDALEDAAGLWSAQGHRAPSLAFGASSTLAKQIDAGAPADLFASADKGWMDFLANTDRIASGSRVDLLGNTLVLVAPNDRPVAARLEQGFDLAAAFSGKLCTGEPDVVPVGIYARQALQNLGMWQALEARIVGADDVRTALSFVERGECALGIVYATDARASERVTVVAEFPAESHSPIVYPFALVRPHRDEARAFLHWLRTAPAARAAFEARGFEWLAD